MALALSPILRFGPGGDFLSDVFADRLEGNAPIAAGESGEFDPGASSGNPGGYLGDESGSGHARAGLDRGSDSFVGGIDAAAHGVHASGGSAGVDGLELSDLARRAGGLLVAQRLLSVHAAALGAASALATSMLATIKRVSGPVRTLRHPADRVESTEQAALRAVDSRPVSFPNRFTPQSRGTVRPLGSSRVPSLFSPHAAEPRPGAQS